MPLTPFHLGPGLFFGLLLFPLLDLPTFLVANVVVDIEPFLVLFFNLDYPLHGFFHSFVGGSTIAVFLAVFMFLIRDCTKKIMKFFRLQQNPSFRNILVTSLLGVYTHILLDAPLYADIKPFYPLSINPFYSQSMFTGFDIYSICTILFLLSFIVYGYKLIVLSRAKT
jgi:membrane-bound metal-dependent hydrolase YbcI (DUF457 family)